MPIRKQLGESFIEKRRSPDFWFNCFLYLCLGLAFWPITMWFAQSAHEQSRILHALIVLLVASVLLVRFGHIEIIKPFSLNKSARKFLITAYGLLALGFLARNFVKLESDALTHLLSLISIPAYCCGLASAVLFAFGEGTKRVTHTVAGTLCAFLLLSLFMAPLDWPLRTLAGQWSGSVLATMGQTVELFLQGQEGVPPQLILVVNSHPFHVASECNGFGVILTSLLIALLLAIYRRLGVFDLLLNLLAGVVLGFVFNTLRIVIIVLLAPSLMEHYLLMHEIVGTITYWGCLALVWVLLNGPVNDEPKAA
jgi:exosortase/archaeosortase family protein